MSIYANLTDKLAELNKELTKVQAELDTFNALPENERLATELHNKQCRFDIFGYNCYWPFEQDWTGADHQKFLEKATQLLKVTDYDTAIKTIEII
jgi:hypothetical protein